MAWNLTSHSQNVSIFKAYDKRLNILKFPLKVCNLSAFQTISVKKIYKNIISYSGSILANLNNIMQTNQYALEKKRTRTEKDASFTWDYILCWTDLLQKMFKI